jgi:hypothetical protein
MIDVIIIDNGQKKIRPIESDVLLKKNILSEAF